MIKMDNFIDFDREVESEDWEKDSKAARASCVNGMSKREWSTSDQSQKHGDEASKKRSGHLIADEGHHCEVICTVRFSNYEPVDEDDDDRKLPVRQEVPCASPPMDEDNDDRKLPRKREVSWEEEEEEEEEEEVIPVNCLIVLATSFTMCHARLPRISSTIWIENIQMKG